MAVYQCYTKPEQRPLLFRGRPYVPIGLEPEVNPEITRNCRELESAADRLALSEYGAMLWLWRNGPIDSDGWVGFTSWRQLDKVPVRFRPRCVERIAAWLESYDVLGWYFIEHPTTLAQQAEAAHPGIHGFLTTLMESAGMQVPQGYLTERRGLMANYWIVKWADFERWMEFSFPLVEGSRTTYRKHPFVLGHPRSIGYVMERLFLFWCESTARRCLDLRPLLRKAPSWQRFYWRFVTRPERVRRRSEKAAGSP